LPVPRNHDGPRSSSVAQHSTCVKIPAVASVAEQY
jgi:hypothetical protein